VPDRKPTPISGVISGASGTGHAPLAALSPQPPIAEHRPELTGLPVPWGRRRVLLLNATFEPLTALPLRRAVVLVVCGKAEVVHGDPTGIVMHSATSSVAIPSVIRLSNYVRVPYRGRVPLTRAGLMHRDRYRCAYCGGRAETIDHVVPRSRGGPHTWQNCVASCAKCNHRKADKLLSELGWRLRVVPAAPRGPHWRLLAGVADADPLWLPYLGEPAA
jgi:5-methylcytosine-specific restriction endonuclease McrA